MLDYVLDAGGWCRGDIIEETFLWGGSLAFFIIGGLVFVGDEGPA